MCHITKDFRFPTRALIALGVVLCTSLVAEAAGLVGYRNDTQQPIVVQSVVTSNGMTRRSKPQTLYPGEVALDSLAFTGVRTIMVYDAKKPTIILYQGDVNSIDDVFFSIRPKAVTLKVKGQQTPPPQVELVKTQPPAMPRSGKSKK